MWIRVYKECYYLEEGVGIVNILNSLEEGIKIIGFL